MYYFKIISSKEHYSGTTMSIGFCVRRLIFIFWRYHCNWQFKQVFCYKIACYVAVFQVIVLEKKQVKE